MRSEAVAPLAPSSLYAPEGAYDALRMVADKVIQIREIALRMKNQDHTAMITGSELADLAGEPYTTVDYWSKMGVLEFVKRGNRRLYDPQTAGVRCEEIRRRQNDGLNLMAIKQELDGADEQKG